MQESFCVGIRALWAQTLLPTMLLHHMSRPSVADDFLSACVESADSCIHKMMKRVVAFFRRDIYRYKRHGRMTIKSTVNC